jgi:Zn-dependent protease
MDFIDIIFGIAILVMCVVVHETAHGYTALALGDPTAKYAGRLSLNPLRHLDFLGSFVVPLVTSLFGMTFGWAKPVPVNPYNLRGGRTGEALVALAGPLSNILLAVGFGLIVRIGFQMQLLPLSFLKISTLVVSINVLLAIFNLIPVPPLDGSKLLFAILARRFGGWVEMLERNQTFLILILLVVVWQTPIIPFLSGFATRFIIGI